MLKIMQNGILVYAHSLERRAFERKNKTEWKLVTSMLETLSLKVTRNVVTLKQHEEIETHVNIQT